LSTNYIPLDSEAEQICQLISGPLEEVSRLDEQIATLQATIDRLSQERKRLDDYIQTHRSLISRARRMPRDVVEEIFIHCLPADRNAAMSASEAPVLLGRICSAWRQISMSTPQLWSSLHFPFPKIDLLMSHEFDLLKRRIEVAKGWLNRSGSRPLSLSFWAPNTRFMFMERVGVEQAIMELMEIFTAHSRQWKSIDIALPDFTLLPSVSTLTEADFPMLRKVELEIWTLESGEEFPAIPMLRTQSIRVIGLASQISPSSYAAHWAQLTELSLHRNLGVEFSWLDALDVLHQTRNLRKCSLKLDSEPTDVQPLPPQQNFIILPFLESLFVYEWGRSDLTNFFNPLVMPHLKSFALFIYDSSPVHIPFKSLCTSSNKLESIQLRLHQFWLEEFTDCLALLPSIKGLYLMDADLLPDDLSIGLMKPLTETDGQCLCPCLEDIILVRCQGLTDQMLLSFLQARAHSEEKNVTRLKRAMVSFSQKKKMDLTANLAPLVATGMEIQLHYFPAWEPNRDLCPPWYSNWEGRWVLPHPNWHSYA
jgi:uncharacterized small protein (DUF1192 family)